MKKIIMISVISILLIAMLVGCGKTDGLSDTDAGVASETVYATEISLPAMATMVVGDTLKLNISATPSDATITGAVWSSSDASVASINDSTGLITAVAAGETTISVSVQGESGVVTDETVVTVVNSVGTSINPADQTGDFVIATEDGSYSENNGVYTLTTAGEYTVSGYLNGEIVIDAGDEDEVTLVLNGVTIKYGANSPILVKNTGEVTIKAAKNTENTIYDQRSAKTVDADDQGEGAISAKCDLKIAATGTLYVEGNYNNGIHTTKDLKIQKVTLKVVAVNNALKGKDSVTIESGNMAIISTAGDGIKTENTDVSSKGNQRGTITVNDGVIEIYAAGDGIQAAYNFEMNGGYLTVYNGSYSKYTSKSATVDSYKGIKVKNELNINGGQVNIHSYDDGLHADYGTTLENGNTGTGVININDGIVNISVTSSSSRYVSGADAIHADNTLNISGGTVNVSSAYEGLEANFINVSGGTITISASDDGLNAANKINKTPAITISGGTVDITMASGDTDGIDSNGTFTMTGGVVISRGAPNSNNGMATGLDCDGTTTIKGGTFIQLGARETVPALASGCYTLNYGSTSGGMGGPGGMGGRPGMGGSSSSSASSPYTLSSGTWTVSGINVSFTVSGGYTYYGCVVYSSLLESGTSYTISNGTTSYTATAN